ncbi:hypothetical protein [Actinopolyspora halophila]|uniref:hypothetical protein n=1 Tax=Actinopolyspora halophila TaxID=1850 RepID=UPI0003643DD4|nr:hypothetical protein [Actinopolyspora halophila]
MVDLEEPVTLVESRLHDGLYETNFDDGGVFRTGEPFEFEVDLDALARRGGGAG